MNSVFLFASFISTRPSNHKMRTLKKKIRSISFQVYGPSDRIKNPDMLDLQTRTFIVSKGEKEMKIFESGIFESTGQDKQKQTVCLLMEMSFDYDLLEWKEPRSIFPVDEKEIESKLNNKMPLKYLTYEDFELLLFKKHIAVRRSGQVDCRAFIKEVKFVNESSNFCLLSGFWVQQDLQI